MTGQEVLERALALLGYTDTRGEPDAAVAAELYKRGLPLLDQLCTDLAAAEGRAPSPVTTVYQPIPLSEGVARGVLPYGVAMLLAAARGDGDNQRLYSALYTAKRRALHPREQVQDVLPRGWSE